MKKLISIFGLFFPVLLFAQDTISFQECLNAAEENSPRLRDKELIDEEGRLTVENVKTKWYPDLTLNGKVTYQSDVVSLDLEIPGMSLAFPEMPHEQFGLNLDFRQTIYDGGQTKQQKRYEQAVTAASVQKVDVDLYALKDKVAGLYFSILLMQENKKALEVILLNLNAREKTLIAAVENGVAEEADLMVIRVEVLKILQSMSEMDAGRSGMLNMLSVYLDRKLDENTVLALPYIEMPDSEAYQRPEMKWFDLQTEMIEAGKELTTVKRLPRIFAYGQAGVGKPGYNMLSDQTDTYYMIGAGLQWKVWDWNSTKRDKQILETRKQVLLNTKESFQDNISAGMEQEMERMEHYKKSLDLDDKILKMRIDITSNASAKLENGVLSASDYLQVLNEESRSRINRSSHQLQLLRALANYNLLNGTL